MKHKNTLGYLVKTLDNLFFRNMVTYENRRGHMDEVTVMHGWILGFLYDNQQRDIFQKDIETEFSIARSTVTSIVKLMEKKGYIQRETAEEDARLKKLLLTPKGIELHQQHVNDIDILEERCRRGLSREELEIFYRVAGKLKQNLEEDIESNRNNVCERAEKRKCM